MHQTRLFQQPCTPRPFCSGHYIPYITCFFPQPEKPKSRVPSFLEKLATLIFTGLPLLGLSAAKLFHFITQNTSSQALTPYKNIPAAFYTKAFLHPSSPDTFYTRHLLYQAHLHPKPFRPDTFYTRHILPEAPFTPDTSYTNRLLHQTTFTPGTFYTNQLLHQTTFTPDNFYTNQTFTPDNFYTNQLLHQTPFTPTSFYTRHLLHQTPFTPNTFYTRHLLHQTTFTLNTFYTNRLLHQTTWQFYFSLVYLFWTPLQQNSGHYIPYITCFFPQPEKPTSRIPFFSEKLATLLFSGLPLLDPSTAKLPPLHPIPTGRKPQK